MNPEPKAPASDLDAAVGRLTDIVSRHAASPGDMVAAQRPDIRLILSALSSKSQAAEGMAKALEKIERATVPIGPMKDAVSPDEYVIRCVNTEARTALSHYRTLGGQA